MRLNFNPYQQPMYPQQAYQPAQPYLPFMQQPTPQRQTNIDWVYVSGMAAAREHIVQPGCTAWMMDNNEPVIYYKSVDMGGQPTFKAYGLTEILPEAQVRQAQNVDMSQYVTRAEVQVIFDKINALAGEKGANA